MFFVQYLGQFIELFDPCNNDDRCADDNAQCMSGYCVCTNRYYESNGVCGKILL